MASATKKFRLYDMTGLWQTSHETKEEAIRIMDKCNESGIRMMFIEGGDFVAKEVVRALKFFSIQIRKGWTQKEALNQVEGSYGERIHYFTLLALQK